MNLWTYFSNNTKKGITKWKHYFPIYEKHFAPLRKKSIKMLEIGVLNGGSLEMWSSYFPKSTIVGIDISENCRQHEQKDKNIHVRIGDQSDRSFLQKLTNEFGEFDLILDDGSHHVSHVNKTFQFMFPKLSNNGIYFIEDVHASYYKTHGGGLNAKSTIVNVAKDLIDSIHAEYTKGLKEPDYFTENLKCMSVYDSIIVFEKGNVGERIALQTGQM